MSKAHRKGLRGLLRRFCAAVLMPLSCFVGIPTSAQAGQMLPDLTVPLGAGLTLSKDPGGPGQSAMWTQVLEISDSEASEVKNGKCTFNARYEITNLGKAAVTAPYSVGLYAEGENKAEGQGVPLAPGETKEIRGRIELKPGNQLVTLHINQQSATLPAIQELNTGNNGGSLKVNLRGTCLPTKPTGGGQRP